MPTNANIVLRGKVSLPTYYVGSTAYLLKTAGGTAVTLTTPSSCNCFATVVQPAAALAPNTLYTFTANPGTWVGPAYSFSFTTGSGPDLTPPHVVSIDPAPGTVLSGLNGPFQIHFDKRITRSLSTQSATVQAWPSNLYAYSPYWSLSSDGTTLTLQISIQQGYPLSYDVTVDPTQFFDLLGNAGQGAVFAAHYTTFLSSDSSGPHLKTSLPADGDTGVPTNAQPRLIFQKPVDSATFAAGIQLLLGGVAQTVSFNSTADSVVSIQPAKPLSANQTYTIAINSSLRDSNGFPLQQPQRIKFTMGAGPDFVAPVVLGASPSALTVPPNVQILLRTNKPIAPMVLDRLATVGLQNSNNRTTVPVAATLSPDGTQVTMVPFSPLPAQPFTVATSEMVDTAGNQFSGGTVISFTVSGDSDASPFSLLGVNPPPDAGNVSTSAPIQLRFNKVCATCQFPNAISVSVNGTAVTTKVSADYASNNVSFTISAGALSPSTTYTVAMHGLVDLVGNSLPDYSYSFTTAAGAGSYTPLSLLDSSPANGDTGVNPAGPFVLHYSATLNAAASVSACSLTGVKSFAYPVRSASSGSTLTVTPVAQLPANSVFQLICGPGNTAGYNSQSTINFTTGSIDDTTPPQVVSISPADGSLLHLDTNFVVTFSKPINPSSITSSSLPLYSTTGNIAPTLVRSEDNRTVTFTVPRISVTGFTVVASAAIRDLAGNPLVPFEANYTVDQSDFSSNSVHEVRPSFNSSSPVPANTPITWFFTQTPDLAQVRANVIVLANNSPWAGSFDLAGNGKILIFTPSRPFPAGALVTVYQRTSLLDPYHFNSGSFVIATDTSGDSSLRWVRTSIGSSTATDSVFDIEFNQDPPVGTVSALNYGTGNGSSIPVAFTEMIPRPHVVRLVPTKPLQPGYYSATLSSKVTGSANTYFSATITATTVGGTPTVAAKGPVDGDTGVPLNVSIRILFGAPLNPVSVNAQTASVSVGGRVLDVLRNFPNNNREIVLQPMTALPPNARIDVWLSGLEDMAGRAIPSTVWGFTTGSDPDYTSPTLVATSLPYSSSTSVAISPTEPIQYFFDKPMDPGISTQLGYGSGWLTNAAIATWSSDLRVLTLTPTRAWAQGQSYSVNLNVVTDLSGNTQSYASNGPSTGFSVAFNPSTAPPNLLGMSPPDGALAMPLNARIQTAFDRPVYVPSSGVLLTDPDGNTVALSRVYDADPTHAVFAPQKALRPDSVYTLSISGASDMSGNIMPAGVKATFTTGEVLDFDVPAGSIAFTSPLPTNMAMRLRFTERISPVFVNSQQIRLSSGGTAVDADLALAADGQSITVNPRQPLVAGTSYSLSLGVLTDFAGNRVTGLSATVPFVAGDGPDNTPPLLKFQPADGVTGFPVVSSYGTTNLIGASFSKPADLLVSKPSIQLLKDGNPVPGTVSMSADGIYISPSTSLEYNATYTISVSNVVDYIGNAAPTASARFTTSVSAAADRAAFRVSSIQPADGSVGVPNNSPVTVTFTKLLGNASAFYLSSSIPLPLKGTYSINGNSLTYTPTEPWPSAAKITISVQTSIWGYGVFRDASGVALDQSHSYSFTAAVNPDPTPLTLNSITPAEGTPIPPGANTFTLVFSKPVIVDSQALQVFNGTQAAANVNISYGTSSHIITASWYASDSVSTLIGTTGIHDADGNTLTPFSFQYPILPASESGNPNVVSMSPSSNNPLPATSLIKLQFNKAMDPVSLVAAFHVTQDGLEIHGQVQVLDNNHSIQFTPAAPYAAGSRIDVFVLTTATDTTGLKLQWQYDGVFTVASAPAAQLSSQLRMEVWMAGFGGVVAPGSGLELAFDHELDPATVGEGSVWLRSGTTRIPGTAVARASHAVRFQPAELLTPGVSYVLTVGPDLHSVDGLSTVPREFAFRVDGVLPEVHLESVELLTDPGPQSVRIRFSGPVNPISADRLKFLAADGSEVRANARFSTDGCEWTLQLPTAQPVQLVLDGVEDRAGRRLPKEVRQPVMRR